MSEIPEALRALAAQVRGRSYESAKRLIVSKVGGVGRNERFADDVADAVFLRLQRNAQVGRYDSEAVVRSLGRNARRLEGEGEITLWRAAPRGAGIRPGDFAADSRHEAEFYRHGGHVIQSARVARADVLAVDGSSGGGQEYVFLPRDHVPGEAVEHFASFQAFYEAAVTPAPEPGPSPR